MSPAEEIQDLIDTWHEQANRDASPAETPDVGIIMGSDSDLDVMMGSDNQTGAYDALTRLGFEELTGENPTPSSRFSFETYVVSAHRTPRLMYAYAETAEDRGLDVIIAGAGGKSADLPNMTASLAFPLPVIGVPVQEKSVDSVIGMPTGAPIVAVDAGKSFNAALSAVQILAREHSELADRLRQYHIQLEDEVGRTSRRLHRKGTRSFQGRS